MMAATPTQQALNEAHRARQARYAAAARNAANKAKPALVLLHSPKQDIWLDRPQQDAHCISYRAAIPDLAKIGANRLKRYIAIRCHELGASYWGVMSGFRSVETVAFRDQLIWEIKTHVKPDISWPELGRLFGRDHSTAISAYRRAAAAHGDEEAAEYVRKQRERFVRFNRDKKARGE